MFNLSIVLHLHNLIAFCKILGMFFLGYKESISAIDVNSPILAVTIS